MVYTDGLDLRTHVFEELGDSSSADKYPRIVAMAEKKLSQELRHQKMITTADVVMTDGVGPLPDDFIEMIEIRQGGIPCTEDQIVAVNAPEGFFYRYAIADGNLYLNGSDTTQSITYYASPASLASDMTTTNWLLEDGPDVYLYSILAQSVKLTDERNSEYVRGREMALRDLRKANNRQQFGNSVVTVEGCTP